MIIERIVAELFAENCYVLVNGSDAVVVDPGVKTARGVEEALARHGATVAAVLLTHGHVDHVWDAAKVAGADVPVFIAEPDRYRLEDPLGASSSLGPLIRAMLPSRWQMPARIEILPPELFAGEGSELVPGFAFRALAAPGHTEGSTVFLVGGVSELRIPEVAASSSAPVMLVGDVIFKDSVGRTDLPGGDSQVMEWTLRTLTQVVDPATVLLPGHGETTTMAREKDVNPFLQPGVWR